MKQKKIHHLSVFLILCLLTGIFSGCGVVVRGLGKGAEKGDYQKNAALVSTKAAFGMWVLWKTPYTKSPLLLYNTAVFFLFYYREMFFSKACLHW